MNIDIFDFTFLKKHHFINEWQLLRILKRLILDTCLKLVTMKKFKEMCTVSVIRWEQMLSLSLEPDIWL